MKAIHNSFAKMHGFPFFFHSIEEAPWPGELIHSFIHSFIDWILAFARHRSGYLRDSRE